MAILQANDTGKIGAQVLQPTKQAEAKVDQTPWPELGREQQTTTPSPPSHIH